MDDRCIFVTGASSDIGTELLNSIGDNYSLIYAHYRNDSENFCVLKERFGERLFPLKGDFLDREDPVHLLDQIKIKGIFPDHFVHLPSDKMTGSRFHKRDPEDFRHSMDISFMSAATLLNGLIGPMVKKRYGRVVLMLSSCILGNPPAYQSPYVTSKYALFGLMKALSAEYAAKGITVNGVSPDMMDTKFHNGTLKKEVVLKENAEINPLGRNITTGDVIPVISYLLSDAAEAVTGQNIAVTGGVR